MFSVCRQYTTCSVHARATDRQIARKKERRTSSREWTKIMTVNLPRRNFWKVAFKTRNFQKCWPLNFLSLSLSLLSRIIDDRLMIDSPNERNKSILRADRSLYYRTSITSVRGRKKWRENRCFFFTVQFRTRVGKFPSPPLPTDNPSDF